MRGSSEDAAALLADLNAIPSVSHQSGDLPYPDIPSVQDNSFTSDTCTSSRRRITSTAGLQQATHPSLGTRPSCTRATQPLLRKRAMRCRWLRGPIRDDHHLMLFNAVVTDGPELEEREEEAWKCAREVRNHWNDGQRGRTPHAYVNYANGIESVRETYGEEWRVERLRGVKKKYDPENRYRWYNPIVRD
ncbi:uncharacterized protein BDV17DRAFT_294747 [Aspergillus undulatus]|uniref:uncharacterized protein n=1 Tax=Aspergillus undulatus TaxID=1810928 RepID=UPI003CCD74A5